MISNLCPARRNYSGKQPVRCTEPNTSPLCGIPISYYAPIRLSADSTVSTEARTKPLMCFLLPLMRRICLEKSISPCNGLAYNHVAMAFPMNRNLNGSWSTDCSILWAMITSKPQKESSWKLRNADIWINYKRILQK